MSLGITALAVATMSHTRRTHHHVLRAPSKCLHATEATWRPQTSHKTLPHTLSSKIVTRTRCQRRATSAPVADTAPRVFATLGVLGRVPSGSRGGRVLSACITFFVLWDSYGCNEPHQLSLESLCLRLLGG